MCVEGRKRRGLERLGVEEGGGLRGRGVEGRVLFLTQRSAPRTVPIEVRLQPHGLKRTLGCRYNQLGYGTVAGIAEIAEIAERLARIVRSGSSRSTVPL